MQGQTKSVLQQLKEGVKENVQHSMGMTEEGRQHGAATLAAYGRGGLKDLQDAVLQAFPESQKQNESLGMIGSPTPQMVTDQLGYGMDNQTDKIAPSQEHQPQEQANVQDVSQSQEQEMER